MHYSSITIIYNPNSTGSSQKKAERLAKRLKRLGYDEQVQIAATEHSGHAEELAYEHSISTDNPLVISSSGDGGYNEVVNGIMKANEAGKTVVSGLLPSGNANDHYKELHDRDILKQIKDGSTKQIDLLSISAKINGKPWQRYAHSYIGFGITPEASKELNKIDLTPAKEIRIVLKTISNTKPMLIEKSGKKQQYFSLVISNVSRMSKFFNLSKDSSIDDGKFEVFTIEPDRATILRSLVKAATSGVPHSIQTDNYSFKTIKKLSVQLDGEVFDIDPDCQVKVSIKPKALSCVI